LSLHDVGAGRRTDKTVLDATGTLRAVDSTAPASVPGRAIDRDETSAVSEWYWY